MNSSPAQWWWFQQADVGVVWAADKLRSVGLKFPRQRRNLSFGLLFPGQMLSFGINPGYLHYSLAPTGSWKKRETLGVDCNQLHKGCESRPMDYCPNWRCDKQTQLAFSSLWLAAQGCYLSTGYAPCLVRAAWVPCPWLWVFLWHQTCLFALPIPSAFLLPLWRIYVLR